MKEHIDVAKDFIDFISESPTKYHAIENVKFYSISLNHCLLTKNGI